MGLWLPGQNKFSDRSLSLPKYRQHLQSGKQETLPCTYVFSFDCTFFKCKLDLWWAGCGFNCPVYTRLMPCPALGGPSFSISFLWYPPESSSKTGSSLQLPSHSLIFSHACLHRSTPGAFSSYTFSMSSSCIYDCDCESLQPAQTYCSRPICLFSCWDLQLTDTGHSNIAGPKPILSVLSWPSQIQMPRPSKSRPQDFTYLFSSLPSLVN